MKTHQQHHYVPAFLLKQWHSQRDARLTQFRWAHGQVKTIRHSAKHVAKARHLYSALRNEEQPDIALERDYLTPHVDEPASIVHAKMLNDGLASFTSDEAIVWARFLVAQLVRIPHMVEHMRVRGREILMDGLNERPEQYQAIRGDAPESSLVEWLQTHSPSVYEDLGVKAMPSIIESSLLNGAVLEAQWALVDIKHSKIDLVIGDRPLMRYGPLSDKLLLAMPVSPRKLFLVYSQSQTIRKIMRQDHTSVARTTNKDMVSRASQFVYGTDETSLPLVKKFLFQPVSTTEKARP